MLLHYASQQNDDGRKPNLTPSGPPADSLVRLRADAGRLIGGPIMQSIRTGFPSIALALIAIALIAIAMPGPSRAAPCGGDFNAWLADFKVEAATQGISQRAIAAALDGVVDALLPSPATAASVFSPRPSSSFPGG
jgi:hypothetical protein